MYHELSIVEYRGQQSFSRGAPYNNKSKKARDTPKKRKRREYNKKTILFSSLSTQSRTGYSAIFFFIKGEERNKPALLVWQIDEQLEF